MAAAVAYGAAAPQLYSPPPAAPAANWGGELDSEEILQRLQKTSWELANRRKILIRNLPPETSSQEIHKLLEDYQLKYCYVDRNKGTAFVTLLDGEQARDAIERFHGYWLADHEISVQLQPTDALLCITNLPPKFTLQDFEELVRAYGKIERCFLVYNEVTGHSKGYGFVEYMKKDYAAKARQELIGKQLQEFTLFAQWMDTNQLTADLIHSKCLYVDKLPKDYHDSEELTQIFSNLHPPVFCRLSKDEGSSVGGFAVIEYDTDEQAEEVRLATNGMLISRSSVQISFCAPGSPGRSTLAALIAAHGMVKANSQKGLLPEPDPMQILKSLNNPAMVQMCLQPQLRALISKHALAASSLVPQFLNHPVNPAYLHLNNAHQQKSGVGNTSTLLQNFSHLQMAQQQLLKLKSAQAVNNKPGLLGEAPASLMPAALAMGPGQSITDLTHHGELQKASPLTPSQLPAARMGILPFLSNHQGGQSSVLPQEKQSGALGLPEGGIPGSKTFSGFANNSTRSLLMEPNKQTNQPKGTNPSPVGSLLGEPPKDYRLSTNPFLNLPSVFYSTSLPNIPYRNNNVDHHAKMMGSAINTSVSHGSTTQSTLENYYSQQYGDYTQEGAQQWFAPYQSTYDAPQEQSYQQENAEKEQPIPPGTGEGYYNQVQPTSSFGDYSTYVQVMPSFYTGNPGAYQPPTSLQANLQSTVQSPLLQSTVHTPLLKTVARNEKRSASFLLPSPEVYPVGYAEPQSPYGDEYYADSHLKRKRVY